jgi:hypothetical protein
MLVKPFKETDAYKFGIIDEKGNNLRKMATLKTTQERDSYTYLHRLVFNMKKIINRLPGGESNLKSIIAALFLVKEYYENKDRTTSLMEERYLSLLEKMESGVVLIEEELIVKKFITKLSEEGEGGVANVAGAGVATDKTVPKASDVKKYKKSMFRRPKPVECA